MQDLDKNLSEAMNTKSTSGVLISDVTKGGPADKAKIKRGDVILRVNGEEINSTERLRNTIATMGAGAKVELDITRNGREITASLILGELPDNFGIQTIIERDDGVLGGMTVTPLDEVAREKFQISKNVKDGVVITKVEEGTTAQQAGLRPGDVILEINRKDLNSVKDFTKEYYKSKNNQLLLILRKGRTFYLVLRR
jgi:serine protease Do